MNRKDLEVYVARLRKEFAAAYEVERVAAQQAVTLMRRLALAEALLDTFTQPDVSDSARLDEAPRTGNDATRAPIETTTSPEFPCPEPGCTWIGRNPAGLLIHQGRMHKAAPRATVSNEGAQTPPIETPPAASQPRVLVCAKGCGRQFNTRAVGQKARHETTCAGAKTEPRFPAPAEPMEWDLPTRRREPPTDPGSEAPRRATPRHGGMVAIA